MPSTEVRRCFSRLLSRAAAGEVIEIERHGEVVALLTPARRPFVGHAAGVL
jgi:antitoxin (DNA-binding transcriptional repressor) of toxin-antitoxin stability system